MEIHETKLEIIQHILMIQKPEMIQRIHRYIHDLDEEKEDECPEPSAKKGQSRVNVIGSKIKGMLGMYE